MGDHHLSKELIPSSTGLELVDVAESVERGVRVLQKQLALIEKKLNDEELMEQTHIGAISRAMNDTTKMVDVMARLVQAARQGPGAGDIEKDDWIRGLKPWQLQQVMKWTIENAKEASVVQV